MQTQRELEASVPMPSPEEADAWLAPVFLDERAEACPETGTAAAVGDQAVAVAASANPVGAARISNKGFLPITRDQYLALLDALGRMVRKGKRAVIPAELPPILERLKLEAHRWVDSILAAFWTDPLAAGGLPAGAFG